MSARFDAAYSEGTLLSVPLVSSPDTFDLDLQMFMGGTPAESGIYRNSFFPMIAVPLKEAYRLWRNKQRDDALVMVQTLPVRCDWRVATESWMKRRMGKGVVEKSEVGVAR